MLNYDTSSLYACQESKDSDRITVAGGSVTEILYFLGSEDKIIAVDITSNYPEEAKDFPSIGYVRNLSAEGILSLKPSIMHLLIRPMAYLSIGIQAHLKIVFFIQLKV